MNKLAAARLENFLAAVHMSNRTAVPATRDGCAKNNNAGSASEKNLDVCAEVFYN